MQRATRVASHRLPLCSQWDRLRALKTRCDKPPHRQDYYRANDCADETSVFARLIPPDCLAKVCCYKSSNNPEHGRHDVPSGLKLISRINQFRDHPATNPIMMVQRMLMASSPLHSIPSPAYPCQCQLSHEQSA